MSAPHYSVLKGEVIALFADRKLTVAVDATLGAGGHAESLLQNHPEIEHFIGFDQDPVALGIAAERLQPWREKLTLIPRNFEGMKAEWSKLGLSRGADAIIFDLGVSSMQFDRPEKGFSFSHNGPLDMRMDPSQSLTAEEIVNEWTLHSLGKIFRDYGEEQRWRKVAYAIIDARVLKRIETTHDLVEVLRPALDVGPRQRIHFATKVFQALRIAVNRELEVIENVLPDVISLLAPGGRLAVISFHSLEDRIVKNALRFAASDKYDTSGVGGVFLDKVPEGMIITRKPMLPTEEEIEINPRSRSAKLRAFEKK